MLYEVVLLLHSVCLFAFAGAMAVAVLCLVYIKEKWIFYMSWLKVEGAGGGGVRTGSVSKIPYLCCLLFVVGVRLS